MLQYYKWLKVIENGRLSVLEFLGSVHPTPLLTIFSGLFNSFIHLFVKIWLPFLRNKNKYNFEMIYWYSNTKFIIVTYLLLLEWIYNVRHWELCIEVKVVLSTFPSYSCNNVEKLQTTAKKEFTLQILFIDLALPYTGRS